MNLFTSSTFWALVRYIHKDLTCKDSWRMAVAFAASECRGSVLSIEVIFRAYVAQVELRKTNAPKPVPVNAWLRRAIKTSARQEGKAFSVPMCIRGKGTRRVKLEHKVTYMQTRPIYTL